MPVDAAEDKVTTMRYRYRGTAIPLPDRAWNEELHADPDRTCGAPGARKRACRVREAARETIADKAGTAPWIDFTAHISAAMHAPIQARAD